MTSRAHGTALRPSTFVSDWRAGTHGFTGPCHFGNLVYPIAGGRARLLMNIAVVFTVVAVSLWSFVKFVFASRGISPWKSASFLQF